MDIILYNILVAILLVIIGYLFGSIPNGIWIGKIFFYLRNCYTVWAGGAGKYGKGRPVYGEFL